MKTILTTVLLLAATATASRAGVILSQTFTPDLTIPEGNPVGVVDRESFTMDLTGGLVGGVSLGLVTSGGYNGDLYAYLVAPNGTLVTLMDQPGTTTDGFGAQSSGMNITLNDTLGSQIQDVVGGAGTSLSGTYLGAETMGTFGDSSADGTWSIYFADLGSGGGSPVLDSWTLDIDVVPEPVNMSLGIFLGALMAAGGGRWVWRRYHPIPAKAKS